MNDLPSLLRNDGGNRKNWIKIKLIGTKCNRTAIGARVHVMTGKHTQMDEVHTGWSVMSQSDLRLHFGLGAQTVDLIEVKWPTLGRSNVSPTSKPTSFSPSAKAAVSMERSNPKVNNGSTKHQPPRTQRSTKGSPS